MESVLKEYLMAYWFKIDLNGIVAQIRINSYQKSTHENWDSQWCDVGFSFSSGEWLNYNRDHDAILLSCEVEELADKIQKLLNDELTEIEEVICIEPDFKFILQPKKDLRENPRYAYVRDGYEFQDVYMEWKIFFWNEGLTDNYLSLTIDRTDLQYLLNYLLLVKGNLKKDSDEIIAMINSGFLYG